jgi:hypothetical protein
MTDKITLELTLDELKLIDKSLLISVATRPILDKIRSAYPKPDVIEIGGVKYQRIEEPQSKPMDEVEWDEKDNSKPMDEVVERLRKKYQAQKLWNILKDEWGFPEHACGDIVEAVAEWLPKEQSAAGSQNVDTELLVDGFNHCLQKMKEMLR